MVVLGFTVGYYKLDFRVFEVMLGYSVFGMEEMRVRCVSLEGGEKLVILSFV